jgi:hypothetical protein
MGLVGVSYPAQNGQVSSIEASSFVLDGRRFISAGQGERRMSDLVAIGRGIRCAASCNSARIHRRDRIVSRKEYPV